MTQLLRARRCRASAAWPSLAVLASLLMTMGGASTALAEVSARRLTPVVLAVREARPAVVNIEGQKLVAEPAESAGSPEGQRQVNGMGTGTIIDSRGYILTNYHVVADVRRIQVTLDDGEVYIAELAANDEEADLAVIKISAPRPLPVIRIGTSSDLMQGEPVIALGNAYGYENTVTRGVISALGRDVPVGDTRGYKDLIQTDASINPGNSGGPLLNIDGNMIGVNVAVRAEAQGIGFAIPIDDAMKVAATLLSVDRLQNKWHGLVTEASAELGGPLHVASVQSDSPAEESGLQPGDEIYRVGSMNVTRPLDLERALLDRRAGESVTIEVARNGQTVTLDLALASRPDRQLATGALSDKETQVWDVLGLKLTAEPRATFQRRNSRYNYNGGMRVVQVRPDGPAAEQGILPGDILVGMHKWETASPQDVDYIISQPNLDQLGKIKFYVLRGQNTLYGHLNVASTATSASRGTSRR
jgi:serine protease Do